MAKDRDIRFQLPDDIVTDIDAYLASIDFMPITTAEPAKDEPKPKTRPSSGKGIDIISKRKRGRSDARKPKPPTSRRRRRR